MRKLHTFLLFLAALASVPALAQNITGTVTNKTTGKPAAGDTVTLIKLGNGMQEADHTTTDDRGQFTLPAADQGMHLVRVTHDKVPYFQPVPQGTFAADVAVYDSSEKVEGVTAEADVLRIQATDTALEATELYAIENKSTPERTQFGPHAFELYLPEGAEITSGAALGPGGMPIQARPVPLAEPGHYAFVFPIRPGETRFQIAYHLPYSGKFAFHPRLSLPTENVALMMPKAMVFTADKGAAFQPVNDDVNAQVYLIKNATPQQALGFTISGTGQMPKESGADETTQPPAGAEAQSGTAMPANRPGGGLGNPIDTPDPLHKYRWWILGAIVALFLAGIAFAMRKPSSPRTPDAALTPTSHGGAASAHTPAISAAKTPSERTNNLLTVLKDEMFALETDRVEGRIEDDDYATVKAGLEIILRHALKHDKSAGSF